jgi:16S rRNA processing protein RimM
MGRIVGAFGVQGWVKIQPFSAEPGGLQQYREWLIGDVERWRSVAVLDSEVHGNVLVARIGGVMDREAAAALRGHEVALPRDALPPAEEGEYYWADLVGLRVVNGVGEHLGEVSEVFSNGAQDVLRVREAATERLIPFVPAYVSQVDLEARQIVVDWQRDW